MLLSINHYATIGHWFYLFQRAPNTIIIIATICHVDGITILNQNSFAMILANIFLWDRQLTVFIPHHRNDSNLKCDRTAITRSSILPLPVETQIEWLPGSIAYISDTIPMVTSLYYRVAYSLEELNAPRATPSIQLQQPATNWPLHKS